MSSPNEKSPKGPRTLERTEDSKVKRLITLIAVVCLVLIAQTSFARGNHRATINRMWREAQEQQKQQDERLKRIEKDAEKSLRELEGDHIPVQRVPYPGCRTCP